jgi:uncharacterized protein
LIESLHVLVKPASGNCNMNCSYCFFNDIIKNRSVRTYGNMSTETLENIVGKSLRHAGKNCTIAFQGGEPTLAGLDFYRNLISMQKKHNVNRVAVQNAIQTNGLLIDGEWASFFAENNFLVGLSIDGDRALHDRLRKDKFGNGTYTRVVRAAAVLEQCGVAYNVLSVVTAPMVRKIGHIYEDYKAHQWFYMQFIPCLDPLGEAPGNHPDSLTPGDYAEFLKVLFGLWYDDVSRGNFVYIRYFQNLINIIKGFQPESCAMGGSCSLQYIVEADGGIYPCDYYVTDQYRIGNLNTDSFAQIDKNREALGFIKQSKMAEDCRSCSWAWLCRGGCRRNRETQKGIGLNYYCAAYKDFFSYAADRLWKLAGRQETYSI